MRKSGTGYKECFFRIDFEPIGSKHLKKHPKVLTDEDRALIEREVLNGTPRREIYDMFENRSIKAVESHIAVVRRKHGIRRHFHSGKRCKNGE